MTHPVEHARTPRLTVAISTYRRPEGLERTLAALRPQIEGNPRREVSIVNDGSHDDAYEAVARKYADIISYRPLPVNAGIAKARNASAAGARGDYLVFTDDDCEAPPWWLDWLEARLDADPELDVIAGTTQALMPDKPRFMERVNAHYMFIPHPHGPKEMKLFVTANVAIRRSLFERVGGFGFEGFSAAGEDTELSVRLANAGARAAIDLNWYVRHDVSDGLIQQMRRFWRYGYANVFLRRYTTAPLVYQELGQRRRVAYTRLAYDELTANFAKSDGFSRWRLVRWWSALVATSVRMAYLDGGAAAAADRRRELRI
jgi:glycosyltransferase involved in cell wall biosynthesis